MSKQVLESILEEIEAVTGHDPLATTLHNGSFSVYVFDRASITGLPSAVEYARELLSAAKAEQEAAMTHPQWAEEFASN